MKFTIEIEEFWLDEEELTPALEKHIKQSVIHDITQKVKEQTNQQITSKVQEVIKKKIQTIIDDTLTGLISTGEIIMNKEPVKITDHVKNLFTSDRGWNSVNDQVKRMSGNYAKELKKQYDNAFANQIVQKMKEQGFLNESVTKMLTDGENEKTPS